MWIVPVLGVKGFPTEEEAFQELNRIWNIVVDTVSEDFYYADIETTEYLKERFRKVEFPESDDGRRAAHLYTLWKKGFDETYWSTGSEEENVVIFEHAFLGGESEMWLNDIEDRNFDNSNFYVFSWETYFNFWSFAKTTGIQSNFPTFPQMVPIEVSEFT